MGNLFSTIFFQVRPDDLPRVCEKLDRESFFDDIKFFDYHF